ncbi:helix-turn-helix domain-containing protein [Variovorax sp. LjRoot290]|uniref:helix-turn-helix domain-containing protein n=1 Tax=unclassified Variovorax TaxID=663243 RepID=UPI003ECE8BA4
MPIDASAPLPNPPALPAGGHRLRYAERLSCDVDEHATHISAWRQEYDQLSCGRFEGAVRELWIDGPRLQIFHEHTGQQTSQQCLPWRGSIWFGVPDGHSHEPLHFSGRLQRADRMRLVMSARADDGFVLRTPRNFGIYGVVVDEEWLGTQIQRLGLRPPLIGQGALVHAAAVAPHVHVALCQTIESLLGLGASGETEQSWGRAALQTLLDQLLGLLAGTTQADGFIAQLQASQRRLAAVMAARSLVVHPLNHAMSVDDLCLQLHLTPRTLRNHFRSVVGESPVEFLRAVRLNACRRKLRLPQAASTVQDVAAQWGFFHMGRFSQEYKAMFGELPSETLRQARLTH